MMSSGRHWHPRDVVGGPPAAERASLCCTLLSLGHYPQTWLASRDTDRLSTELEAKAATVK
ncbi:hypothetical protein ACWC0A_38645 [Streptomyces scopuliridis]